MAAADGIDVMLISGGRGLYTRVGCRAVGQDWTFRLTPETAARPGRRPRRRRRRRLRPGAGRPGADRRPAGPLPARAGALPAPPRGLGDGLRLRGGDEHGVRLLGRLGRRGHPGLPDRPPAGQGPPAAPGRAGAGAGGGVRRGAHGLVAGALPRLLAHYGRGPLTVHVQGSDPALRALLTAGGLSGDAGQRLRHAAGDQLPAADGALPPLPRRAHRGGRGRRPGLRGGRPAGQRRGGFTIAPRGGVRAPGRIWPRWRCTSSAAPS